MKVKKKDKICFEACTITADFEIFSRKGLRRYSISAGVAGGENNKIGKTDVMIIVSCLTSLSASTQ